MSNITDSLRDKPDPATKPEGNGTAVAAPELPMDRAKTVEYGLVIFQQVSAERDQLKVHVEDLEARLAQSRVEIDAQQSLLSTLESRAKTHMLDRDQAIADRAVYEVLFVSFQAQLRAFKVPAAPLIKNIETEG